MTIIRDPNLVHETGSDDTFWNAKVIREGETFSVQVYDADGDRRPEREDSFADQALAIAFADRSVLRASERQMMENQKLTLPNADDFLPIEAIAAAKA